MNENLNFHHDNRLNIPDDDVCYSSVDGYLSAEDTLFYFMSINLRIEKIEWSTCSMEKLKSFFK